MFLTIKLCTYISAAYLCWAELFEMELFFDIETEFMLNWIV